MINGVVSEGYPRGSDYSHDCNSDLLISNSDYPDSEDDDSEDDDMEDDDSENYDSDDPEGCQDDCESEDVFDMDIDC